MIYEIKITNDEEYTEAKAERARLTRQLIAIGMTNWGKAQALSNEIEDYERSLKR